MDHIHIENLEVYAHHGVAKEEKTNGQMFLVSLQAGLDLEEAGLTDDLGKTVSYAKLCRDIQQVLQQQTYNLIETAARKVIADLFDRYPQIEEIRILLKKPWAPMGQHLDYAAVEMERRREDMHATS